MFFSAFALNILKEFELEVTAFFIKIAQSILPLADWYLSIRVGFQWSDLLGLCVMVPNLGSVMNSSVTINTGLCTYSRWTLDSRTDF